MLDYVRVINFLIIKLLVWHIAKMSLCRPQTSQFACLYDIMFYISVCCQHKKTHLWLVWISYIIIIIIITIRQRILYKLSTTVYKCIHGASPSYLKNLCVPVATNTSRRYLCSATHGDLQVPRTRTVTYGPQSFAVSGPTIWNTLPSILRVSTTTLGQFQSGLKTILFHFGLWDMT